MSELHTKTPAEKEVTFLGGLTKRIHRDHDSTWTPELSFNGIPTKFDIDTSAEVSVISTKAYRVLGSLTLHPFTKTL